MLPLKPLPHHYAMENLASVYDEEAMTALELAGRTTAKINETVEAFNKLKQGTDQSIMGQNTLIDSRMAAQDNAIRKMNDETMPEKVKEEFQENLDNGTFEDMVDTYAGELEARVDNLLGAIGEGSTTLDAEVIDIRVDGEGTTHANAGESVRYQNSKMLEILLRESEDLSATAHAMHWATILKGNVTESSKRMTDPSKIFGVGELIPAGLTHIAVKTDEPVTLHFFDPVFQTDANSTGSITLRKSKTIYPKKEMGVTFSGVATLCVYSDTPYFLGIQGTVKFELDNVAFPVLLDIAEDGLATYSYTVSEHCNMDVVVKSFAMETGTDEVHLPLHTSHLYVEPTTGDIVEPRLYCATTPVYSNRGYKRITIKMTEFTDQVYALIYFYDKAGNWLGRSGALNLGYGSTELMGDSFRIVISTLNMTTADYYDPARVVEITLSHKNNRRDGMPNAGAYNLYSGKGIINVKLIGDSITQGSQSTGYIEYTDGDFIIRGNGDTYPNAGDDYVVGDYLGTRGSIKWYEATSGSGWGQLLKAYFERKFKCTVKNYGMGGATVTDLINNLETLVTDTDHIVVVMIGTNDRKTVDRNEYIPQLRHLVYTLKAKGKEVILVSPPPVAPIAELPAYFFHAEDIANYMATIADDFNIQYINLFNEMCQYCEYRNKDIGEYLGTDGIHPNDTGYELMYRIITRGLGLAPAVTGKTHYTSKW